jgi:lipopolysaccharide biosynthesis regulator YciM
MIRYFRVRLLLSLMILLMFSACTLSAYAQKIDPARARDNISKQDLARASDYFSKQQYEQVVKLLESALVQVRENAEVQRLLGHAAFAIGRHDLASQAYGNVIAQGEFGGDILGRVAEIARNAGRLHDAIAALRLAMLTEPDFHGFKEGMAGLLIDVGDYPQAEQLLDDLLQRRPDSAVLYAQMGNLYLRKNQPEYALSRFLMAYYLGLDNVTAMETIATLYARQGERETALTWYDRLLEREDKPGVRLLRARLLFELDQFDASLHEAQQLIRTDVADEARRLIIQISLKNDDHDTAAMHREQASGKDAWIRAVDTTLANYFYRKNDFQRASHYFKTIAGETSSQQSVDDEQVLYPLIVSLIEIDAVDDVRQYLRVYLKQVGADMRFKELLDRYLRLL